MGDYGQTLTVDDGMVTAEVMRDGRPSSRLVSGSLGSRTEMWAAGLVVVALLMTGVLRRSLGDLIPGYRAK